MPSVPQAIIGMEVPMDECGRSGGKERQRFLEGRHQRLHRPGGCRPAFAHLLTFLQNLIKESLWGHYDLGSHLQLIEVRQDRRDTCEQCGVAALYVRPDRLSACP